jgi:hypothetical protein
MSWLPARAATPVPLPRIGLKVLLIGTAATEPNYMAWQSTLQREGVRFDTVVGPTHTPITASTLSSTLSDGTSVANYDAIIVSVGNDLDCTATCVSDLSPAEWTAIQQYEHRFNVRQISGYVYPGTTYGMNPPSVSGALDGTAGALTADGQKIFPYLKPTAAIKMDTGTYGYQATPISPTNFHTLVSGPGGSSLVGIYAHPDGTQEMVETFNQNSFQLQSELLRHGALAWATRGVYFGDQRNYLVTHIDDNFLSDSAWNSTTHSTDFTSATALRMVPADVTQAAAWSHANNFRIDMLFNGGGSVAVSNGSSLPGDGGGGTGGTGGTGTCTTATPCPDTLLAAYQATDPATGKPYTGAFGWVNHTWDHPNIDGACATQNYIQAELNQNTDWGAKAPGATPGDAINGGLGLTQSTDPTVALGNENPTVMTAGEHSGIANLLPGNPGQVDPPSLNSATPAATGGTLAAGDYVYAVSDHFNTAAPGAPPAAGAGESAASVSAPVTVTGTTGSVTLTWTAVCHAADYKIYRAPYTAGTIGAWSVIGTVPANTTTDFTDPTGGSTTNTAGGGPVEKTFTDTSGTLGTTGAPSTTGSAVESAYAQNPVLNAAFPGTELGGIKYFGSDASKPYPNPADGAFPTGSAPSTQYAPGATFSDAGATAIPRYPTNIYYNVATNAQQVDEYQTLYDLPTCTPVAGVTTCNPAGTPFPISTIVASVDQGMFQHMMGNDPRPHYFHQTNLMSQTTGPVTGKGDGLYYETMNPLLAQYNSYFASNAPIVQPTMAQTGTLLSEQANWAANSAVSGYIQGNQVTVTNSGGAVTLPLTGITTVGSAYGGTQSGWTSVPGGSSTYTAATTWPVDTMMVTLSPAAIAANGTSTSTATATLNADGNPAAGDPVVFTSTDAGEKIGPVTDNLNGTYTATITSSTTAGPVTITATDAAVAPMAAGQATLAQNLGPAAKVVATISPTSIVANGTSTSAATAMVTDASGRGVAGDKVAFTSTDAGEKIGTVVDNRNGTYTATITSSTSAHSVTITATDSSVSPSVSGQGTLTQTAASPASTPPSDVTPPSVSGTTQVGRTLSAKSGTWQGTAPISYAYQWQRCKPGCAAIAGATSSSYTLRSADLNARIRVAVTASNAVGHAQAFSAQVGPVRSTLTGLLTSLMVPSGKAASVGALLAHNGYSARGTAPAAGSLRIIWVLAKGKHPVVVAKVSLQISPTGKIKIKIVLSRAGRKLIRHASRLKLTAKGTIVLVGMPGAAASRSFTVRRVS